MPLKDLKKRKAYNKKQNKKYYNEHAEYLKKYHKLHYQENIEQYMKYSLLNRSKRSAIKKNFVYELDRDWLDKQLAAGTCSQTGLEFVYESNSPYTPSIDRIDSSKGYTKDNCQIVCNIYNFAKNIWDDETVKTMARALLKEELSTWTILWAYDNMSKGDKYGN